MAKRWSKTEISYLKRHAATATLDEMAAKVHSDPTTVRQKLSELGLTVGGGPAPAEDPALAKFEQALERYHGGDLDAAAKLFQAVAAEADEPQLADRGRQYLAVCERRQAEDSGGDPYLRAVCEKNRGNLEVARELVKAHGDGGERYVYLEASLDALGDDPDAALAKLRKAIELEPRNRVHAYHDPDFAPLRGREEFQGLLGGA